MSGKTLYDKIWESHAVRELEGLGTLLYIDRHLLHEITSPQAFDGLRLASRKLWRPGAAVAVMDHNVPTINQINIENPIARLQLETLKNSCEAFGVELYGLGDPRQGIVHIIGPESGLTLPGMTLVCGDSHTSTHGALATLAFGIGTSEVEHVMATQCLVARKTGNMRVEINGELNPWVSAKDIILALIGKIGTNGASGYTIEYCGSTIRALSVEARMTVCNMSIEAGARAGLIAVDDKTIEYVRGREFAPRGEVFDKAIDAWRKLQSDPDACFDQIIELAGSAIEPQVTWGTTPGMVLPISGRVPDPSTAQDAGERQTMEKALEYMQLTPGTCLTEISLDKIFIGSCTNARIEDLRAAAEYVHKRRIARNIKQALVVPGSEAVKRQAEAEGLDKIFVEAGFEWRSSGCSMCLGMNPDRLGPGERCASTSNRNFEGRQGRGGRSHLASPVMVAAAAVHGHFIDPRRQEHST